MVRFPLPDSRTGRSASGLQAMWVLEVVGLAVVVVGLVRTGKPLTGCNPAAWVPCGVWVASSTGRAVG